MRLVNMAWYWLLYKIVRFEPTLNFGWLKQSTVVVASRLHCKRGDEIAVANKPFIVIGTTQGIVGSTMTFVESDRTLPPI
jgi:hypothetical protein